MNRDSDITEDSLLKLLLETLSVDAEPSGIRFPLAADAVLDPAPVAPIYPDPCPDPWIDSEPMTLANPGDSALNANPTPVFDSGDLSTVQPHFEALLKRRLRQEISHRPPLFPWEKGLQDYPDNVAPSGASIWLDHLRNLAIPGTVPEDVLADLFNECQRIVHDIQQPGRRLVAAVESLFADQPQTLDYVAGLVARPAYRSAQAQTLEQVDYATASTPQQVALAMLAAQSIFEALSLTVSAEAPTQEQSWLTTAGDLLLQATYKPEHGQLEVRAILPIGGSLVMTTPDETLGSERSTSGELVLRLATQPGEYHRLDVGLGQGQVAPMNFQVKVDS